MEDNGNGDQVMDEEFSAEKLLDEQIPGEEGLGEGLIDEKILDESLLEEEDFNFENNTESIVDYFCSDGQQTIDKINVEPEDKELFERLRKQEDELNDEISKHKILVVGAGGIGCEVLKDMVLTGFKDIVLIDLDTIDVSNLNRQFLFRRNHVSQPKATVARESALEFNPNANIVAHHDSIFSEPYGVSYFQQFKFVLNALDNRSARNHVNRLCLAANVPLIETGTSGYHGQVEVIVKGISQCYECEPKPVQKTYPGCTIRNTPSEPVHCIVWAKHLFNQLFGEEDAENEVSPDSSDPELYEDDDENIVEQNADTSSKSDEKDVEEPKSKRTRVESNVSTSNDKERNVKSSDGNVTNQKPKGTSTFTGDHIKLPNVTQIIFAEEPPINLKSGLRGNDAKKQKNDNINENESDGNVKRTSTRDWARESGFSPELLHKKFFIDDIEYLLSMKTLWKTRRPPTPSEYKISELPNDVDAGYAGLDRTMKVWTWPMCIKVFADSVRILAERFSKLDNNDYLTWDKDDDVALDFVTSCANIRSYIFGIPATSRFDAKAIAGNIIPAIATTNAIVSGIAILHSLNILRGNFEKVTTVHLRKYPNPNGELFLPERNIIPPNSDCYVCSLQNEIIIALDVNAMTVEKFKSNVLREALKLTSPDVVVPSKSLILISSEEGETDENNKKFLIDVGVVDGSILHADDFDSDRKICIIVKHLERTSNEEPLFSIISLEQQPGVKFVEPDNINDPKPGCSKDMDTRPLNNEKVNEIICIDDDISDSMIETTPKTNGKATDPNKIKSSTKTQVVGKHKLDEELSSTVPKKKLKSDAEDTANNS